MSNGNGREAGRPLIKMPCLSEDVLSQRFRVGPGDMVMLELSVGQPVWITEGRRAYLCQAWPRTDLCDNHIQFDLSFFRPRNNSLQLLRNNENGTYGKKLQCLENGRRLSLYLFPVLEDVVDLLEVTIEVAAKSYVCVPALKRMSSENLSVYFQQMLHMSLVAEDIIINAGELMCKTTGVTLIKIQQIHPECSVGRICHSTKFAISRVMSKERLVQKFEMRDFLLGGLDGPAESLKELIKLRTDYSREMEQLGVDVAKGILLRGPPGCGKTSLVHYVCQLCDAHLLAISGAEVVGSRPGESEDNLRELFKKGSVLSEEGPCVLFLDEVDTFCPKSNKSGRNMEHRLVSELCRLMDAVPTHDCLIVVGATNRPNAIDPALRRPGRFDKEVFIGVPTQNQRRSILSVATRRVPLDSDVDLDYISEATNGYSGADLVALCHEASYLSLSKLAKEGCLKAQVTMADFKFALGKITPSSQRGAEGLVDSSPVQWDDIGGYDEVKIKIQQAVEWPMKHSHAFARLGLQRPHGVLLYGPPGCSKTMLVRAAATSCHVTFLSLSGAQLFSPFVGDSEKAVSEVFQRARASAPSIVFFDEIDSIIGKRSDANSGRGVQERVLSTLLNEMDGVGIRPDDKQGGVAAKVLEGENSVHETNQLAAVKVNNSDVLLVAATNRPDLLDDALLRPGRIDRVIYVPPPDEETRLQILQVQTRNTPIDGVDFQRLASSTEGYTGADLENLCREAAMIALGQDGIQASHVTGEHFERALETTAPSVTKNYLRQYEQFKKAL